MNRQHFCAVSNIVASSMDSKVVSVTRLSVGPLLPLPGNKPAAASLDDSADEQVAPSCNKDTTVVIEGVGFAVVIVIAFAAFAIGVMLMSSLWFIYVKTSTFYHTLLSFLLLYHSVVEVRWLNAPFSPESVNCVCMSVSTVI